MKYPDDYINKIICGNCLKVMKGIPDGVVDLVLTDPPYGVTACDWDSIIPIKTMWSFLNRVTKSNAPIILTAIQPFSSLLVCSNLTMFRNEWIWNKVCGSNFMSLKSRPLRVHEQVLVFSKESDFTFNPIREMRSEKSILRDPIGSRRVGFTKVTKIEHCNSNRSNIINFVNEDNMKHPTSIITVSLKEKIGYAFSHPTKKPLDLFKYLIKTYSNEGGVVLDFTIGSGTTAVACKQLGRKYIGIEINPEYCKIAEDRLRQEELF